jgi:hypothetical protein
LTFINRPLQANPPNERERDSGRGGGRNLRQDGALLRLEQERAGLTGPGDDQAAAQAAELGRKIARRRAKSTRGLAVQARLLRELMDADTLPRRDLTRILIENIVTGLTVLTLGQT